MSRALALLVVATSLAILVAPLAAREPEPSSLFSEGARGGFVADAMALDWTVRRLTSTIEAVTQSQGAWGAQVIAVVSPTTPYSVMDADSAVRFVEQGGILLVADAFEQGNSLVSRFGISFTRGRLVETAGNSSATLKLGSASSPMDLVAPTGIHVSTGSKVEVLSWSSDASYLDLDGDGLISATDPAGPFPMAAKVAASQGDGYLLAIAEPAVLTDATSNASVARRTILASFSEPGLLVIDESHHPVTNPAVRGAAAVTRAVYLEPTNKIWIGVGAAFGIVTLIAITARGWLPHAFRPERFLSRMVLAAPAKERPGRPGRSAAWTSRGIAALAGGAALCVLGVRLQNLQAQYAGAFLLVAAAAASIVRAPSLRAALQLAAPKLQENVATTCGIEVDNPARRGVHVELRTALPPEMEVGRGTEFFQTALPPRTSVRHEFELVPAVRGPYSLGPVEARRQDPLRLRTATAIIAPAAEVRVRPSQEPLRTLPFGTRVPMVTMGPHLVNRAGEGMEFHSLREYQLGDSIRIVNWKASARSKDLVVNQRVHETMTQLTIVLDARAVMGAGPADATPIARLSRAVVSMAASMLRVRDRIRIFVYGSEITEAPAATGSRQFDGLMDLLSDLRPAGNIPFKEVAQHLAPRLRPKTPILVATCAEADPTLADGLRLLTDIGLLPVVLTAPIHSKGEPGLTESEAQDRVDERDRILNDVRGVGATVYEVHPGLSLESLFRQGGVK